MKTNFIWKLCGFTRSTNLQLNIFNLRSFTCPNNESKLMNYCISMMDCSSPDHHQDRPFSAFLPFGGSMDSREVHLVPHIKPTSIPRAGSNLSVFLSLQEIFRPMRNQKVSWTRFCVIKHDLWPGSDENRSSLVKHHKPQLLTFLILLRH